MGSLRATRALNVHRTRLDVFPAAEGSNLLCNLRKNTLIRDETPPNS